MGYSVETLCEEFSAVKLLVQVQYYHRPVMIVVTGRQSDLERQFEGLASCRTGNALPADPTPSVFRRNYDGSLQFVALAK